MLEFWCLTFGVFGFGFLIMDLEFWVLWFGIGVRLDVSLTTAADLHEWRSNRVKHIGHSAVATEL